jgi:hypothetical protein
MSELTELLQDVMAYGMIRPVKGVRYGSGTHEECNKKLQEAIPQVELYEKAVDRVRNMRRRMLDKYDARMTSSEAIEIDHVLQQMENLK